MLSTCPPSTGRFAAVTALGGDLRLDLVLDG